MTAKKKETTREKELTALILGMIESAGDHAVRELFPRMHHLGITTEQILKAIGYGPVDPKALTVGMWIQVYWYDSNPTWCLLLEKPELKKKGDVSLKVYDPVTNGVHSHATLSQVIDYKEGPKAPN